MNKTKEKTKEPIKVEVKEKAKDKDVEKEKPKDGMAQYTQFSFLHDSIDVAGGACKSPFRCKKCVDYKRRVHSDPEFGDRTYSANACSRTDHPKRISVHEWFRRETERIMAIPGRRVEMRPGVESKVSEKGKFALFVDDRSKHKGVLDPRLSKLSKAAVE